MFVTAVANIETNDCDTKRHLSTDNLIHKKTNECIDGVTGLDHMQSHLDRSSELMDNENGNPKGNGKINCILIKRIRKMQSH